jgi:hypothetical protein
MHLWFKSCLVAAALVSTTSFLALAQLVPADPNPPSVLWYLTVSYCYVDHCTDHDRAPNYWKPGLSFTSGEDCLARIETITEGQSREMARHRVLACALKSADPGPGTSSKNKFDEHHPYPDPELGG